MRVLSCDPGPDGTSGTTGFAYQDENSLYELGDIFSAAEFFKGWDLQEKPIDYIVVEGYFPLPGKEVMHYYRPNKTSEQIGRIKMWAELNDIPIHEYRPADKPKECKATQVFPKKVPKAIEHRLDAYNHGRWFLIEKGLALTALELEVLKG
jgi:hypothetical protein